MVVFFVQLHFTTRVRYGFLSVQLNYTICQVYDYMLKKEAEGKPRKVAKIAALKKFLRIVYARIKELYDNMALAERAKAKTKSKTKAKTKATA